MKGVSTRLVIASLSLTSVFSITIQRRAVSTVEHHCDQDVASSVRGLEESFQVCLETYAKIICLRDETRQEAVAVTEQTTADTVHSPVVRATADQQVPGSIPDGDHGLPS